MNAIHADLEPLHRAFEAVDDSVRNLESNPNSARARRRLTRTLEPFLLSLPPEEQETLAKVLERVRRTLSVDTLQEKGEPSHTTTPRRAAAEHPLVQEAFERREALMLTGELLRSDVLQSRLGVSRQALSKRVQNGTLFYVDGKGGARYYPAFFADPSLNLAKVKKVSKALSPLPGASRWLFFTSPRVSLGGVTPLDIIGGAQVQVGRHTNSTEPRTVDFEDVLRAAQAEAQG